MVNLPLFNGVFLAAYFCGHLLSLLPLNGNLETGWLPFLQIELHSRGMDISPAQCRAARALLDWTQGELANKVGVAVKTIRNFEGGLRTPHTLSRVSIKQALEKDGIEFLQTTV